MDRKKRLSNGLIVLSGLLMLAVVRTSIVLAYPCPADLNSDGKVDVADLMIMQDELDRDNCFTFPCRADLNGDGKVNGNDGEILIAEFGRSDCFSGAGDLLGEQTELSQMEEETEFDNAEKEEVEEGTEPPVARFIDNDNGTVTDPETGLMWTKDANLPGDTMLFHQALDYIAAMNEGKHPNFGYTDWRLPALEELRSLIDYTNFTGWGHVIPSGHPFQNVQLLLFNDSRLVTYLSNSDYSLFVSLYCRLVGHNVKSCYGYVWPVRGGQ